VDVAAGVEVPLVDDKATLDAVQLDADDLDAQIAGEAPGQPLLEGRDVGQVRSSAAPSS
jgi:hypothetical protein